MDEWVQFDQSIVDAAISQWRRHLSACVCVRGHTSNINFDRFWTELWDNLTILLHEAYFGLFCANLAVRKFLQLTTFSVVWQFGTSAFYMVVLWHKLGEVKNECTSHNFSLFAISLPKIIKIGRNLTKSWQIQICLVFLRHGVAEVA